MASTEVTVTSEQMERVPTSTQEVLLTTDLKIDSTIGFVNTSISTKSATTSPVVLPSQSLLSSLLLGSCAIIGLFFAIIITMALILCFYCRRRQQYQQSPVAQSKVAQPNGVFSENMISHSYSGSTLQHGSTSMGTTVFGTTMFTQNQMNMSLPGFLEVSTSDFRLINQIAKGGGGAVHLAEGLTPNLSSKGHFIAKVMNTSSDESLYRRIMSSFQQEVSIMYLFKDHPNIAKLVGYCFTPPVILVKYYEIGSLEYLMFNSKRSKRYMLPIMEGIASGLKALHWNGIVHCDLKPDNVLIELSNYGLNAVLSDFGISRVVEEKVLTVSAFEVITIRGLTYPYAAPEVLDEKVRRVPVVNSFVTKQRDIYAFAVIVYAYLSGRKPWS